MMPNRFGGEREKKKASYICFDWNSKNFSKAKTKKEENKYEIVISIESGF